VLIAMLVTLAVDTLVLGYFVVRAIYLRRKNRKATV
jgi:hypothetical protein